MNQGTTPQSDRRPGVGQAPERSGEGCRYAPGHTEQSKSEIGRKMMHGIGLIGGTFDRFHLGHMSLIKTGLSQCEKIEVWVTDDKSARLKDRRVKNWEERKSDLENATSDFSSRITIHLLVDNIGPALEENYASAIICTNETIGKCLEINSLRAEKGFIELEVISAHKVVSWDGKPISSSRIRKGEIDREGNPWIPESFRGSDSTITSQVEVQLKQPFGQLIEGPEEDTSIAISEAISQISNFSDFYGPLFAVGDVTVLGFQRVGKTPDIAFIDGQTKRVEWPESRDLNFDLFDNVLGCTNPPGSLTESLLESCEQAISSWLEKGESSLIVVSGEEDLTPLLIHPLAPLGSAVIYGQPGMGVVIRYCDEDSKNRCRTLLQDFETC